MPSRTTLHSRTAHAILLALGFLATACKQPAHDASVPADAASPNCVLNKDGWYVALLDGYALVPETAMLRVRHGSFNREVTFHKKALFGILFPSLVANVPELGEIQFTAINESMTVTVKRDGRTVFTGKANCVPASLG